MSSRITMNLRSRTPKPQPSIPEKREPDEPSGPYDRNGKIKDSYRFRGEPYDDDEVEPGQPHNVNWWKVRESGMPQPEPEDDFPRGFRDTVDEAGNVEVAYTRIPGHRFQSEFDGDFKKAGEWVRGHNPGHYGDIRRWRFDALSNAIKRKAVDVERQRALFLKDLSTFLGGADTTSNEFNKVIDFSSPQYELLVVQKNPAGDIEDSTKGKYDPKTDPKALVQKMRLSRSHRPVWKQPSSFLKQYVSEKSGLDLQDFDYECETFSDTDLYLDEKKKDNHGVESTSSPPSSHVWITSGKNISPSPPSEEPESEFDPEDSDSDFIAQQIPSKTGIILRDTPPKDGRQKAKNVSFAESISDNDGDNESSEEYESEIGIPHPVSPRASAIPPPAAPVSATSRQDAHSPTVHRRAKRYNRTPFYPDFLPPPADIIRGQNASHIAQLAEWLQGKDISNVTKLTNLAYHQFEDALLLINKGLEQDEADFHVFDLEEDYPLNVNVDVRALPKDTRDQYINTEDSDGDEQISTTLVPSASKGQEIPSRHGQDSPLRATRPSSFSAYRPANGKQSSLSAGRGKQSQSANPEDESDLEFESDPDFQAPESGTDTDMESESSEEVPRVSRGLSFDSDATDSEEENAPGLRENSDRLNEENSDEIEEQGAPGLQDSANRQAGDGEVKLVNQIELDSDQSDEGEREDEILRAPSVANTKGHISPGSIKNKSKSDTKKSKVSVPNYSKMTVPQLRVEVRNRVSKGEKINLKGRRNKGDFIDALRRNDKERAARARESDTEDDGSDDDDDNTEDDTDDNVSLGPEVTGKKRKTSTAADVPNKRARTAEQDEDDTDDNVSLGPEVTGKKRKKSTAADVPNKRARTAEQDENDTDDDVSLASEVTGKKRKKSTAADVPNKRARTAEQDEDDTDDSYSLGPKRRKHKNSTAADVPNKRARTAEQDEDDTDDLFPLETLRPKRRPRKRKNSTAADVPNKRARTAEQDEDDTDSQEEQAKAPVRKWKPTNQYKGMGRGWRKFAKKG